MLQHTIASICWQAWWQCLQCKLTSPPCPALPCVLRAAGGPREHCYVNAAGDEVQDEGGAEQACEVSGGGRAGACCDTASRACRVGSCRYAGICWRWVRKGRTCPSFNQEEGFQDATPVCVAQAKDPKLDLAERVQGVAALYSTENIFLATVSPKVRGGRGAWGGLRGSKHLRGVVWCTCVWVCVRSRGCSRRCTGTAGPWASFTSCLMMAAGAGGQS